MYRPVQDAGSIVAGMALDEPRPHGTRRRYQSGCKCRRCTSANTAYQREYRHKNTPRWEQLELPRELVPR